MHPNDEPDEFLPETLRSALRNRYGPSSEVPTEVDRAILADARRHLASTVVTRQPKRSLWKLAVIGSSIAAACVLFAVLKPPASNETASVALNRQSNRDLDGNGRIDMLDAFAVARQVRSGGNQSGFDVNRDGRLDQADIDEIARQAVLL